MEDNASKNANINSVAESIENLAVMTARGFEGVNLRLDKLEGRMDGLEGRMGSMEGRMGSMEGRMGKVESEIQGLRSSVNNYLELSDKRYLELKARQNVIATWVKTIADKTGVKINLDDLEKVA